MEIDAHAALRLFQAVVAQALIDATAEPRSYSKKPPKRRGSENDIEYAARSADMLRRRAVAATADRDEARYWLLSDGENFPKVTSLAGYNPTDIRERARKLAAQGWPQRRPALAMAA